VTGNGFFSAADAGALARAIQTAMARTPTQHTRDGKAARDNLHDGLLTDSRG
jgi:hypothetical protein